MTTPTPATETEAAKSTGPQFRRGDVIFIPGHNGRYVAEIVHVYDSFEAAEDGYERSFRTILQHPFKKPRPDQYYYYCEIANSTRKPLGVAEEHATLKHRSASTED